MTSRPPKSTLTYTPFPYTTLFRSHLAFRARSDLMDRLDQQVDHRIRKLSFPRHQINGIEPELARRYMPAHLRGFLAGNPANDLIDPCLARRSAEHTSELPSLMRISYAVFCLKQHTIRTSPECCSSY